MPIYEYKCQSCEKITEKITSSTHKEIVCPNCGAQAKRIVSIFSGQSDTSASSAGGCVPGSGFT